MIELSPAQRRALRAKAHPLHPVVSIGQQGLTPAVLHEIDVALRAHGLIKVRVFSEDRVLRETMLLRIADELDAAPVQHLGKLLILWRPREEEPEESAARPAKKSRKDRFSAGSKRPSKDRTARQTRQQPGTARRARGPASAEDARSEPDARRRRSTATTKRLPRSADDAQASGVRRRRSSSSLETLRAPTGKSAPNPRRRRRAG